MSTTVARKKVTENTASLAVRQITSVLRQECAKCHLKAKVRWRTKIRDYFPPQICDVTYADSGLGRRQET